MTTTRCDELKDLLPLHGVGDTDLADALAVEEHVDGCPACAAALADYRTLCDDLRGEMAEVPPPPEPWTAAGAEGRRRLAAGSGRGLLPAWTLAAAALLLAGVLLGRWSVPLPPAGVTVEPGTASMQAAVAHGGSRPPIVPAAVRRPPTLSVFSPAVRAWLRQATPPAARGR